MSWAICQKCGKKVHWRAGKGSRLADLSCDKCGGELRSESTGKEGANKGKKFHLCIICNKKRIDCKQMPFSFTDEWDLAKKIHPTGSWVCVWDERRCVQSTKKLPE